MKKKLIAIAIAAAVAAPLTAQAAVNLGGDAEFKMQNTKAAGWAGSNRVRIAISADVGGGVMVNTRLRMSTTANPGAFGGDNEGSIIIADDTTGAASTLATDGVVLSSGNMAVVDYANIVVPVGPATLTMGDQLTSWGTKYFTQDTLKHNRLKATFKPSNQLTANIVMDPVADSNGKGAPLLTVNAVMKVSNMMNAGLAYTQGYTAPGPTTKKAKDSIFVTGQMSGVVFGVESQSANTAGTARSNYAMAGMKAGGVDLGLHYAKGSNADSDWSPLGVLNGDAGATGAGQQANILGVIAGMDAGGMMVKVGAGQSGADGAKKNFAGLDLGKKLGAADFNFSYGTYDSLTTFGFSFETKF